MKITFLGTSHGVPGPDRYCQSMLIDTEQGGYIVDAGAPVLDCLLRMGYDLRRIKAVFLTHMDNDHVCYLFGLVGTACWYYKETKFDVYVPEQRAINAISGYLDMTLDDVSAFPNDRIHFRLFREGMIYQDDSMKVTAFPTEHLKAKERPAYGYLMEAEGKKLYISGDLNGQTIDYPEFLEQIPVDLFVVECAHFSAERLIERLQKCVAKRVMPVHIWPVEKYAVLQKEEGKLPFRMEYPDDGSCYEL